MFGSKSDYFNQDSAILKENREHLEEILRDIWDRNENVIKLYLDAYDYFTLNPKRFDGATIVKDVKIIKDLDIWAMIHDYMYIIYNVSVSWEYKYYSDLIYAKEMEIMGQAAIVSWGRFAGLIFFGHLLFTPYQLLIGKRMSKKQRKDFYKLYKNLY